MGDQDMNQAFNALRAALDQIEVGARGSQHSAEAVHSLARAVDNLRTKVWVHITTHRGGDLKRYLGEIRVRRATEVCSGLLSDLDADNIAPGTPGIDLLRGALRELKMACKLAKR
jgi:hypothetical protein